jgi:hypothetical protein
MVTELVEVLFNFSTTKVMKKFDFYIGIDASTGSATAFPN